MDFTGKEVPDGERMTQEEFALMGKPWIKPTKGMRVGLSHLAPKWVPLRAATARVTRGRAAPPPAQPQRTGT